MSDPAQTEQLYTAHREALVRYALSIVGARDTAEDLVQEACIRFLGAGADLSSGQARLAYLHRIVRNLAFDLIRRQKLETTGQATAPPLWAAPTPAADPEQALMLGQQIQQLHAVLAALPPQTRIAMEMYRFGGARLSDIADHLGVSVATAHRHVQRAMAEIAEQLFPDHDQKTDHR